MKKVKIEAAKPFGQIDEFCEKEKMLNKLTIGLSSENKAPKADTDKTDEYIQKKHKPDKPI